ncbi:MAG: hypothetical protein SAK29_22495 [Scytonema sp. PMC 1069.18]|nr:hypothetical protein [Scytonema sp. PMC 1069.18]MEC4885851.1 hypothetical protein [Scytonema sp. PMC 1070.18]
MLSDIQELIDPENKWSKLTSIGMINSWRTENGKTTLETRYFSSSLPNNAELLSKSVRTHWNIENKLHCFINQKVYFLVEVAAFKSYISQNSCSFGNFNAFALWENPALLLELEAIILRATEPPDNVQIPS